MLVKLIKEERKKEYIYDVRKVKWDMEMKIYLKIIWGDNEEFYVNKSKNN